MIGIAALAENMPDGGAIRPGDVLTAYDGQTVEVLNTDAEGRLVLADANAWVIKNHDPSLVVNIATLTGAAVGALGNDYAALFSRSQETIVRVQAAGDETGEATWQLPMHPDLASRMESDVATVMNVIEGGRPGASIGAQFLATFVPTDQDWAHLDIAPVAWRTTASPSGPIGAVGYGVKLFDELVRRSEP